MAICIGCGLEVVDGLLAVDLDPGGSITCGANGLIANFPSIPCTDAVTGLQEAFNTVDPVTMPLALAEPVLPDTENIYTWKSGIITIANPLNCEVSGTISIRCGGLQLTAGDGFFGQGSLDINKNGIGFGPAFPDTIMVFENTSGGPLRTSFNNLVDENWATIPALGSITYQAAFVMTVFVGGTGTMYGTVGFEFNYTFPPTGA